MYHFGSLYMDEQKLDDQLEPIYSSSVSIRDVTWVRPAESDGR